MNVYTNEYFSPIGKITLASDGDALIGLWFEKQKYYGSTFLEESSYKDLLIFDQTKKWLDDYFLGLKPDNNIRIKIIATPFQEEVINILRTIPYGHIMTYKQIAEEIAKNRGMQQMSARAVGTAIGHNPISIIIPCHRVIGVHNQLTGYAGGIDKKIKLLELEGYLKTQG